MKTLDVSCLQYRLTESERQTFNETGWLMVEDTLSEDQIATLTAVTDRIYAAELAIGHDPREAMFYPNFIPEHTAFLELLDYEKVLSKVWGILGLGWGLNANGHFSPQDEDVPLRGWLSEHSPEEAH